MNVTEPIINAALLGTAAKEFIPNGLPETLEENFRLLQEKSEDAEDAFYQFSAQILYQIYSKSEVMCYG